MRLVRRFQPSQGFPVHGMRSPLAALDPPAVARGEPRRSHYLETVSSVNARKVETAPVISTSSAPNPGSAESRRAGSRSGRSWRSATAPPATPTP